MATAADFARIGNYARMYNRDRGLSRETGTRSTPMRVLCLGYSRTGTMSMHNALQHLGFPCYHFSTFYDNVQDCDIWLRLIETKFDGKASIDISRQTFDALLGEYGAVVDMPCHLFAAELMEFYPDAKIVLVERNVESWYKSWQAFLDNAMAPALPLLAKLDPYWAGRIISVGVAGVDKQVGSGKTVAAAKARSREEYRKHYALVRALAAEQNRPILEFQLSQGWEPLCDFLGIEKPKDVEFPHVNDSVSNGQSFQELALIAAKNGVKNIAIVSSVVAIPIVAGIWWMRAHR